MNIFGIKYFKCWGAASNTIKFENTKYVDWRRWIMQTCRNIATQHASCRQKEADDGDTWGQGGPHPLEAAEGGDGGLHVRQLPEGLPWLGLHCPGRVDADQVGQLWVKLAPLQKGKYRDDKNWVKRGWKTETKKKRTPPGRRKTAAIIFSWYSKVVMVIVKQTVWQKWWKKSKVSDFQFSLFSNILSLASDGYLRPSRDRPLSNLTKRSRLPQDPFSYRWREKLFLSLASQPSGCSFGSSPLTGDGIFLSKLGK